MVAHNFWANAAPFGAAEVVSFDVFRIDEDGLLAEHWDALMPNTPPNPSGRTLTDGATEITDLDKTEANKAIAAQIFDVIINGTPEEVGAVVTENFLPDYIQHSPTVADGIPAVFEAFGREQWVYTKNHKVIGECKTHYRHRYPARLRFARYFADEYHVLRNAPDRLFQPDNAFRRGMV